MFHQQFSDLLYIKIKLSQKSSTNAVNWASKNVTLTSEEREIIFAVKRSLLYHKGQAWEKKGGEKIDVTMGSFDGAETAELVGLFMLSKVQNQGVNIGLYRDDILAISSMSARNTENVKKSYARFLLKMG